MREPSRTAPGPPPEHRATEYLANERTFLAWIRTAIAVVSLGFVVSRFSVWLRDLGVRAPRSARGPHLHVSVPIGEAMMAFGAVLAILAAWRYHVVNRAIERGIVSADRWLVILVTVIVVLLTTAMVAYIALVSPS